MFTVLLADDESSVLETLKSRISWQELGVGTVLTAGNGEEALVLAKQQPISLVVADIRMPAMDGLTLIRHIRQFSPDTHCIMLSAYNEFEYAREAISLGVENYLLKPLEMEELEQTIKRALENIYSNRSEQWLTYSNTLLRWTTGAISADELADRATHLGINLYLPEYASVCVQRRESVSLTSFLEKCQREFASEYTLYHCRDDQGHSLMVLGGKKINLPDVARRLNALAQEAGVTQKVRIALGPAIDDAENLAESYQSAMNSLEMNAACTEKSVLAQEEADASGGTAFDDVMLLLHVRGETAAQEEIRRYAEKAACENSAEALLFFMKACTRALLTEYPVQTARLQRSVFDHCERLERARQTEGFRKALEQLLLITRQASNAALAALDPAVRLAMESIRSAYAAGISIREFCGQRSMNPAYLGHLFKRETGVFFNEYLARVRIVHASQLLRDPELRIYDIATRVGFSSASYFVKSFKALTGMSPAKFRITQYHISITEL